MTMRLSEAIRLGAMVRPQAFGTEQQMQYSKPTPTLGLTYVVPQGTCAIGAALEALNCPCIPADPSHQGLPMRGNTKATHSYQVPVEWMGIFATDFKCPQCGEYVGNGARTIPHLNDIHKWTREQIADWVELHEPVPAPEQIEAQPETTATEATV